MATINGTNGDDTILPAFISAGVSGFPTAAADSINGFDGNDNINGGGDGNDKIYSDGDGGIYNGGADDDAMYSGLGSETMDGGTGIDTIDHRIWNGDYVFNMVNGLTN